MSSSSLDPGLPLPQPGAPKTKRTATLMRAILSRGLSRNVMAAVVQNFVAILAQLSVYSLLIRQEGIEVLGLWSLTVGLVGFARLADFSGGSSLSRFVAVARARADGSSEVEYVDSVLIFTVALYTGIALVMWYPFLLLVQQTGGVGDAAGIATLVALALLSLILTVAAASQLSAIDGLQRADIRSMLVMLGWVVHIALAVVLIPRMGLLGLALAQIGQQALTFVLARGALVRRMPNLGPLPLQLSRAALRETMSYGLRLQLNTILLVCFDPLSRVVIGMSGGLGALGTYEVAYRLVGNVRNLVTMAVGPLVPAFASASLDSARHDDRLLLLRRVQVVNLPAAGGLLGLVILVSPALSIFMLGGFDPVFLHLVIGFALTSLTYTLAEPIRALARGEGRLRGNILGSLAMAVGAQACIPVAAALAGGDYAGLGVAGGVLLGSFVSIFANVRVFELPVGTVIPWRRTVAGILVLILLSALVLGLGSWLLA